MPLAIPAKQADPLEQGRGNLCAEYVEWVAYCYGLASPP
jgi:hypothetical protein